MTQSMPTPQSPTPDSSSEQILWRLQQPLDMNRVKRRRAPGKGTVPYLEGFDVIEAANDLFLFRWSFDLLSEPHIMRWDKALTFYDQRARKKMPVLGEDGNPTTEIAGVAYVTGRTTVELDGQAYNHADAGARIFTGDTPEALDMAIAGSVTDCLKRCFRQLGEQFGNSLYDKEIARTAGLENGASSYSDNGRGTTKNGGAHREAIQDAQRQASTPATIQPDVLLYQHGSAVFMNNLSEARAFNAYKAAHDGQAAAAKDALRSWSNGRKGTRQIYLIEDSRRNDHVISNDSHCWPPGPRPGDALHACRAGGDQFQPGCQPAVHRLERPGSEGNHLVPGFGLGQDRRELQPVSAQRQPGAGGRPAGVRPGDGWPTALHPPGWFARFILRSKCQHRAFSLEP